MLLKNYGSLDGIISNVDKLKGKLKDKLDKKKQERERNE